MRHGSRKTLSLAFLALFASLAEAAAPPAGVVKVEARPPGSNRPATGTGSLVEVNGRFFVLTAAHVAADGPVTLDVNGQQLRVLGRLADHAADVEWIEVEKPASPTLAAFHASCNCLKVTDPELTSRAGMAPVATDAWHVSPAWARGRTGPVSSPTRGRKGERLPTASLAEENFTRRRMAYVAVPPGSSGSALVRRTQHGLVLDGVTASFDRAFDLSYFSSAEAMHATLQAYQGGARGQVGETRTRTRRCSTFRDYGNGLSDLSPSGSDAGDTDDGKGDTDDGKGDTDDGSGCRRRFTSDPFRDLGALPGISYEGKPVLALLFAGEEYSYGDRAAIELLRTGRKPERVLPWGSPLQPLLLARLQGWNGNKPLKPGDSFQATGHWATNDRHADLLVTAEGGVKVSIPLPRPSDDVLEFELDELGRLKGAREFRPVIMVKGKKSGFPYYVDLRSFYFQHLSSLKAGDFPDNLLRRGPSLKVRAPGGTEPIEFEFRVPDRVNALTERQLYDAALLCAQREGDILSKDQERWLRELEAKLRAQGRLAE